MKPSTLTAPAANAQIECPEWLLGNGRFLLVELPGGHALLSALERGAAELVVTRFDMIGPSMLRQIGPAAVIAPLIGGGWDITDLALRLQAARFRGRLLAVSVPLPRGALVLRELRNSFPELDIGLMEMPDS